MKRVAIATAAVIVTGTGLLMPARVDAQLDGQPDDGDGTFWNFSIDTDTVGLEYSHGFDGVDNPGDSPAGVAGGLTIGDVNNDGWDDIFAVTGENTDGGSTNTNPNKLFISNQNGTFTENASGWGLSTDDYNSAGPLIVDLNGDGHNDLLIGGHDTNNLRLYLNSGSSTFNISAGSGLPSSTMNFSATAVDFDGDSDLDLALAHWEDSDTDILFTNDGNAQFTDVTAARLGGGTADFTFTPSFADLNGDGRIDLMLASDFGDSRYYHQNGTGTFVLQATGPLTDENGMGGAVGDYDNDGDFDWFVTSIWFFGSKTGNRLYQNNNGSFSDVSAAAGVREGDWGWGACFADFNNDMHLDIYHVNGYFDVGVGFESDPARMFINDGDGTFTEQGATLGVNDTQNGRSVLCFDNDRDGDIDILVHNNSGDSVFYRNNLSENHYITIRLKQPPPNADAVGAVIKVTSGGVTQMRQVVAGSNFGSSHPVAQHFGLGTQTSINSIEITWPDGSQQVINNPAVDQYLEFNRVDPDDVRIRDGFES